MRRWLWKEWREKRIWTLIVFASTGLVVLHGDAYTFCGSIWAASPWVFLSVVVAAVFGAFSFSTELRKGSPDFIYSRPSRWPVMLFTKLVVGLGSIVAVVILTVLLYRMTCPEQLRQFAGAKQLTHGGAIALAILGVPYLMGFASSVIANGVGLGIASLPGWFYMPLLPAIDGHAEIARRWGMTPRTVLWPVILMASALLVQSALAVRFGLTVPRKNRAASGFLPVVLALLGGFAMDYVVPLCVAPSKNEAYAWSSFSPDGRFVVARWDTRTSIPVRVWRGEHRLVRLSDGASAALQPPAPNPETTWLYPDVECFWTRSDKLFFYSRGEMRVLWLGGDGRLVQRRILLDTEDYHALVSPSLGGTYARVYLGNHKSVVLDIEHQRRLNVTLPRVRSIWWESDNELGYIDMQRKRHVIRLPV